MILNKNKLLTYCIIVGFSGYLFSCKSSQSSTTNTKTENEIAAVKANNQDSTVNTLPDWVNQKKASERYNYQPSQEKHFKLLNTKLDVSFDWTKQYLNGVATLKMKPWFYPEKEIELDAKGFDIHKVALVNLTDTTELKYNYDSFKLKVYLNKSYNRNEELSILISYTAKPNELETKGSDVITSDKGLYFINPLGKDKNKPKQIWTQGETQANSCWFPTFDAPNVKTAQEIFITVDSGFTTISNGKLIFQRDNNDGTRTDYWKQEKPHAPYLFMMAIGEYAKVKDKYKDLEVNYYVEAEYEPYAKAIFGNTPEMIGFFETKLNYPYPWDKYAQVVVRDFVSGAMENTSATIMMENLQVDNHYLMDDHWDGIIAHELFHHWFGDLVTCESWSNLPLNESFASYSEYLWTEYKYGVDEADRLWAEEMEGYLYEAESKQENLIRFKYADKEDMFDSHSYAKGGLILHSLRKYVGDDAFFEALHLYLKQNEYKDAEVNHLRLAFEEVTGQDLNWFFNQWFMASGHPEIEVQDSFENGIVTLKINQRQNTDYTPVYTLPVDVAIWVNGQKAIHRITITEQSQSFTFKTDAQPDLILFDAQTQIVGLVSHVKTTDRLIYQFRNAEKLLARQEALFMLKDQLDNPKVKQVFMEALEDDFWLITQLAISVFEGYDKEDKNIVADKFKNLITGHPKSRVRATALETLATIVAVPDIAEKAMNDSSYYVVATALYVYAESGGADHIKKIERFENISNINFYEIAGYYYSDGGVAGKQKWFSDKIAIEKGTELQLLLSYYGVYLLKQDVSVQKEAVPQLVEFAKGHSQAKIKIAAITTLSMLDSVEGVGDILKEIKEEETDKDILEYFKNIGQ